MLENIASVESANLVKELQGSIKTDTTEATTGSRFVDWVANEMMVVNDQIQYSELQLRELAAGRTDNLHHVMLSLNKASLSFELMVEVRNKVLEGYQEVMRMQL